ncbi:fatty-acid-CoA ligase, partial [Thraustotheca clavata]
MDAVFDPVSAVTLATSLVVVTVGVIYNKKRKRDEELPRKPMLKTSLSDEILDGPILKRARTAPKPAKNSQSIAELLKQRAIDFPDKVVYTFLDDAGREVVTLTFGQLDTAARSVAATLQKDGNVKKGDRVMLAYPPGLDFAMGFWGCLYAGAVGVPVYPPYPGTLAKDLPKFNRMVEDSDARVILTNRMYYMATQLATAKNYFSNSVSWPKNVKWFSTDAVPSLMASSYTNVVCTFDDLAFFQYSSGSTSEPKAVMVSFGNVNAQLKVWAAIRESDTMISWVPSYHDMGLVVFILAPACTGARCVSMSPLSFIKDPSLWMRMASKYKATQICAPNFGYALAARKTTKEQVSKMDLRHLRQCLCAAEPIRIESLNAFTKSFSPAGFNPKTFGCGYGLAEATLAATGPDPYNPKVPVVFVAQKRTLEHKNRAVRASKNHPKNDTMTLVGCGTLRPTFSVIIVDPTTREKLSDCQVGEIWIQGDSVTKGYWKREQYTKEQFHATIKGAKDIPENYYLRSGDMGFFDKDVMYVTSRIKDLIIVRGRNICPQDVERTTELANAEVRPGCVAAFSIETSNQEEALVVVAELRTDLKKNQEKLRSIVNTIATAVLSEHQLRCASIVLLKPRSIPKTTSGKIQRRGTKAKFEDNTLAAQYIHKGVIEAAPKPVEVVESEEATEPNKEIGVVRTPDEIVAWLVERLAQENNDGETASEDVDSQDTASPRKPAIDPDTPWACLGMDSVAIVGLSAELGEFLGCVVPPSAFFQYDTPTKLANAPGLATGELEMQDTSETDGISYVDENGEIKPECYDFEAFPEVQHLRGQLKELTNA